MYMIDILDNVVHAIVVISICVVLPIVISWLNYRKKQQDTEKRTEIIMAEIEKNGDIDVQDYLDKLTTPQKSLNEKLTMRLNMEILFGTILTSFGVLTIVGCICGMLFLNSIHMDTCVAFLCFGMIALAVGVGLLAAYSSGKKLLKTLNKE